MDQDRSLAVSSYARACTGDARSGCEGLRELCRQGYLSGCETLLRSRDSASRPEPTTGSPEVSTEEPTR